MCTYIGRGCSSHCGPPYLSLWVSLWLTFEVWDAGGLLPPDLHWLFPTPVLPSALHLLMRHLFCLGLLLFGTSFNPWPNGPFFGRVLSFWIWERPINKEHTIPRSGPSVGFVTTPTRNLIVSLMTLKISLNDYFVGSSLVSLTNHKIWHLVCAKSLPA